VTWIPNDFGFSEEHELLRQQARRFFEERCPISEVRRLAEDPLGHDPALWKELGALGWVGLALPEAHGGSGLGFLPLSLLLDEMGRRLVPSPYLPSLLGALAIEAGGSDAQQACWLPDIASGDRIATLALYEPSSGFEPAGVRATAEPTEGGFVLRGQKRFVLSGGCAQILVAPFREPSGQVSLFVVELPAKGANTREQLAKRILKSRPTAWGRTDVPHELAEVLGPGQQLDDFVFRFFDPNRIFLQARAR